MGAARAAAAPVRRRRGRRHGPRRRRLVDARRAGHRGRAPSTTATSSTTTTPRCPTRARGGSPTACTGGPARSTRPPSPGPTRPGPAGSSPARSSTSCTSARSPPRAPSTRRSAGSTTCARLGVDLVELLPVNAFNGTHNWGYDGVLWSAVHEPYGGPAAYQRFVDACHAAGLGVILDVVYNHLGPSGNYLPVFGPYLKSGRQHLGRPGQPRRRGLRRGAPLHHRQRPDVAARLPRRRPAARRRARAGRLVAGAPARGDGDRGGRALRPPAAPAHADRRVRPQRPPAGHAARGRRLRARRPVERRLPPRGARRADRRDRGLLRRLRAAGRARQGVREGLLPRRHVLVVPRTRPRRADRHRHDADVAARGVQPEPRPDRQPGPGATGSPRRSTTTSSPAPRC